MLWDKAHDERLSRSMLDHILQNHYQILSKARFPCDVLKRDYCLKCLDDLQRRQGSVIPAIKYLIEILGHETTFPFFKIEHDLICFLVSKHDLILILLQSIHACQLDWWNKTHDHANMDTPVNERLTHEESIQNHLDLLSLLLKKGNLFLLFKRSEELWDTLIANERANSLERDLGFTWFINCIEDHSQETQSLVFQKRVNILGVNHLSPKGNRLVGYLGETTVEYFY
jgi:hypothetical protein